MDTTRYDVVVVGGGAAGLSAATTLGRALRSVLVIDSGTPRNGPAAGIHGYLSRDGMNPRELLTIGRSEVLPTEERWLTATPSRHGEPPMDSR